VTINDGHGGAVTQAVTVTATGTNDVPVINGAPMSRRFRKRRLRERRVRDISLRFAEARNFIG
jgi:hypothetical protein